MGDEEEALCRPCSSGQDRGLLLHDGGGGSGAVCAEDETDGSSSSSSSTKEEKNKPPPPPSVAMTSCLLPARSLRSTEPITPADQAPQSSSSNEADCGIRSLSFSKIFSFRLASWAPPSLSTLDYIGDRQLDHGAAAAPTGATSSDNTNKEEEEEEEERLKQVCRSQSVPTSVRRFNRSALRRVADSSSVGPAGLAGALRLRLVPQLAPPPPPPTQQQDATATGGDERASEEEEDIAAEEAVCRICMVALSEEAVLKLECCCKGELALAHRGCAIKWFSIKGNGTCDVCSQEVLNLPVTLRRRRDQHPVTIHQDAVALVQSQNAQQQAAAADPTAGHRRYGVWQWHGTPILVIISMLAYFCFLEQMLVGDHGTAALAISLPFACVLGLFSSLTTTKMVSRRYVWIYSAVQFLFIVLFTHLFYRYVRMQAVIAIILSTFAGFSVSICTNSVLLQILRWRARHLASQTTNTTTGEEDGEPQVPDPDLEVALPPL